MRFTKMHGCGNDYLYVNCLTEMVYEPEETARKMADRHFGVGSDGLILIGMSQTADFRMTMYNADGSRGKMCGNGIRCVGKYVFDHGMTDETHITVETDDGIKTLELFPGEDGLIESVTVDMGCPDFCPASIPVHTDNPDRVVLQTGSGVWEAVCLAVGSTHAVIFTEDPDRLPLETIGPQLERHPLFPNRTNVEFVCPMPDGTLRARVWERGSNETLACGTGACAILTAAVKTGRSERQAVVEFPGGRLHVFWDEETGKLYLNGPAVTVFEGEFPQKESLR